MSIVPHSIVSIPFNNWSKMRLLYGKKTATSRNKRYGEVGDVFTVAFGEEEKVNTPLTRSYRITHIEYVSLGFVADLFWEREGAFGRSEFINVWNEIHPRKRFNPEQKVYLHLFDNETCV